MIAQQSVAVKATAILGEGDMTVKSGADSGNEQR